MTSPGNPLLQALQPVVEQNFGSYLVGTFLGTLLYGFALHQAYRYARLFPTDILFVRALVVTVLVLLTFHTIITMHTCYYYLVTNYANPEAMLQGIWSLNCIAIVTGVNMFIAQLFFVRRVFLIGRHYRAVAVVATLSIIAEIGLSIVTLYKSITVKSFQEFSQVNRWIAATYAAGIVADSFLTGSLIKVLHSSRTQHFSSASEPFLNTIITYTINTGLLHDVLNIVSLCLALIKPDTLLDASVSIVTTKVYGVTLLTVLNSRKLQFSQGIKIFGGGEQFGMNTLARAKRQAVKERWNVPEVQEPSTAVISITVTTEMEGGVESSDAGSAEGKGVCLTKHDRAGGSMDGVNDDAV
ncbi:hypothetical protein C8Q74DRAFT_1255742 [Fomes fomentarius]|nr:hypothetical protein C8Q74DRAFT_1255742 [Fomes fomentarius]